MANPHLSRLRTHFLTPGEKTLFFISDDILSESSSCSVRKCRKYTCWLLSNTQVWLCILPITVVLPVMVAAKDFWSVITATFFMQYITVILMALRNWRAKLLLFGAHKERTFVKFNQVRILCGCCTLMTIVFIGSIALYTIWYGEGTADFTDGTYRLDELKKTFDDDSPYPICNIRFGNRLIFRDTMEGQSSIGPDIPSPVTLSVMDSMMFASVLYEIDPLSGIQKWFGDAEICKRDATDCSSQSDWEWVHESTDDGMAVYFHMYHKPSKTDVITIRGTAAEQDWAMNVAYCGGSAAIKIIGYILPIQTLLSTSVISQFVAIISKLWYLDVPKYHEQILDYIKEDPGANSSDHFVYFIGHSLGAFVAELASAKFYQDVHQNTQSFALANPGAYWSSTMFDVKPNIFTYTSTTLNAERDFVPMLSGQPGGLLFWMNCQVPFYGDCHMQDLQFCEMARSCYHQGIYDASKYHYIEEYCDDLGLTFVDVAFLNSNNITQSQT